MVLFETHDYDHPAFRTETPQMQCYHYADFHLLGQRPCAVRELRRWQNGDVCEAGGRIIGSSDPQSHAYTLAAGVLGHAPQFSEIRNPHDRAASKPYGAIEARHVIALEQGVTDLLEQIDQSFDTTFRLGSK